MTEQAATFIAKSTIRAADKEHRRIINSNINRYNDAVQAGKAQFRDLKIAGERAKNIKWRALETLDQQLEEFERRFSARGGKVLWAETAEQALAEILTICKTRACKTVVKSKSTVTEEIQLNTFLQGHGIECIETELGEYIQQLDGETAYHMITPAIHKNTDEIAKLFAEKLSTASKLNPEQLTEVVRRQLREKFLQAEIGITGVNFLISDAGAVVITENEGNARLSCAWPKVHIAIAGLEKVIPSLTDLGLFLPMLSTYGTGQQLAAYNTILSGPRLEGETDGPEEMYVILIDNGRTSLLANEKAREALYCIRCGACLNTCPVYRSIGGHSYNTTYNGPIGSIVTPHLKGFKDWHHLSRASTLCGSCTEVCPVKINLHELLLENRHEAVIRHNTSLKERLGWKAWKLTMLHRGMLNKAGSTVKSRIMKQIFKGWATNRSAIHFPEKSFNELWKERHSSPQ